MNQKFLVLILGFGIIWFLAPAFQTHKLDANNQPLTIATDYVMISKLSLKAPIVYVDSTVEAKIQEGLRYGVVHYQGTALPGEIGNSYIVGHSSDFATAPGNYKKVFAQLPELIVGDKIVVERATITYNFEVIETKIVERDNLEVLSQDTNNQKLLSLQTSYPIGTSRQRFIVVAKLVDN